MKSTLEEHKPIFIELSETIEDHILSGVFVAEGRIPSMNEYALMLSINPHTVLKAMNILVDQRILYKKRGLGMFVTQEALQIIKEKRSLEFTSVWLKNVIQEAKKLGMDEDTLVEYIRRYYDA
ncbi:MAG: GntR family transcriptional regulator [Alcaligenaceae bacterium]|nr:GntR family transcriptional regulator [Alcaligenaceae bacterium]